MQLSKAQLDRITIRESIDRLNINPEHVKRYGVINAVEFAILQSGGKVEEGSVDHNFAPGFYLRTIHMPAISLVVSKRHNSWHTYVVTKGAVLVYDERTDSVQRIQANGEGEHFTSLTEPGSRRLLLVVQDTDWTCVHPTSLTDVAEIEARYLLPNNNPLLA